MFVEELDIGDHFKLTESQQDYKFSVVGFIDDRMQVLIEQVLSPEIKGKLITTHCYYGTKVVKIEKS